MEEIIAQFMNGRKEVSTGRKCTLTFCGDSNAKATVYCQQCKLDLCSRCEGTHRNNANEVLRNHQLVPFTKKTVCSRHTQHLYTLHCVDCNASLCEQCDRSIHLQHRLRRPDDIATERSFMLEQAKLRACELSCRLLEHKSEIQDKLVSFDRAFAEAETHLEQWKKSLMEHVETTYKTATSELKAQRGQREELESYEANIDQLAHLHQELADFIETVQSSPAIEIAQQQEGITRLFPSLSIANPEIRVPNTSECTEEAFPEFDLNFTTEPFYELMTLSDDDYLDEDDDMTQDGTLNVNSGVSTSRGDIIEPKGDSNKISDRVFEEGNKKTDKSGSREGPTSDADETLHLRQDEPNRNTPAVRREKSTSAFRQQRQLSLEQIPYDMQLKQKCCRQVEVKVHDIKWSELRHAFVVRTNDYGCPLKLFSLSKPTLEDLGVESLAEFHIGLCVDSSGSILCTQAPGTIRVLDAQGQHQRDIVLAEVSKIRGITYSAKADAYIVTDSIKKNVVMVDAKSGEVKSIFGGEEAESTFQSPVFITCDNSPSSPGVIAVSDRGNHCVKLIDLRGSTKIKFGRHGNTGHRKLKSPAGVWLDPSGSVVVCDWGNQRVVRFGWDGRMEILLNSEQLGERKPFAIDISPDGIMAVTAMGTTDAKDTIMVFEGYISPHTM